ncbi:butyrophilin subfamily 3 member A2-like [Acanthopagrus latus]|uniref:butyrophilin subfamily 3 member A2-like n=1 Tax=Acanthopagrus latus TaxID=8177 RepID=UPI00187CDB54|nr:butyrophilin subfamily 3 member A2-like [Acanthopagrus latus]
MRQIFTMPHLKEGLSFKLLLSSFSSVVFHTVVFLHLLWPCAGQSQVVGPSQPIVVIAGDDIILPCQIEPAVDASVMTVEWTRPDLNPRFVHVWRDGVELENKKHPSYNRRTSVSVNKLRCGDISLKLSKVRLSDSGKYRCFIPTLGRESTVELVVGVISSIVLSLERTGKNEVSSGLALKCKSTGWYPEPEVFWLDGEGNLLSAGPTETVRGPDDLYTVSSRVTVEKRHSNSFTCRVQQNHTNQTREAQIHVPEDVFMEPSCSNVGLHIILSVVCVLVLSALVSVVWKLRRNKSQNKKHHNKRPEEGPAETELLVNGQKKVEHLDDGKLDMTETDWVSVMTVKKNKLEHDRDKLKSQIEEVETEWTENKKKLQSLLPINKNNLLERKQQLNNKKNEYEKSLQAIMGRIQTTEDIISRITERMKKVDKQVREMMEQPEDTKGQRDKFHQQSDQPESKEETDRSTDVLTTAETQTNLHVSDSPAGGSSSPGESSTAEQTEIKTGEMMTDTVRL